MSDDTPREAVLAEAASLELGAFTRRVGRRVGIPGVFVCLALLIAICGFAQKGPYNFWTITGMAVAGLIVVLWAYMWIQRVRGGMYLFEGGFVDAAGTRRIAARWSDVVSVKTEATRYSVSVVPIGTTRHYKLDLRIPPHPHIPFEWELNTTYDDVSGLAAHIAGRAGLEIEYVEAP